MGLTLFKPGQAKVTYVHSDDENYSGCKKKKDTTKYLDEITDGFDCTVITKVIPPIVVIKDPENQNHYVYDGNVRAGYANRKGLTLRAIVISTQSELDEYLKLNPRCWFSINDFDELLSYMRRWAEHPYEDQPIPADMSEMLERRRIINQQNRDFELFGPDDDD